MKYQYLLMTCLLTFCKNKDNPNETPKEDIKPNPVKPVNSSSADYKYEGCTPFPHECLDEDNNIDWNNSKCREWRNNYMNYLKRNADRIKQEIKTDVVKTFEKYYQKS